MRKADAGLYVNGGLLLAMRRLPFKPPKFFASETNRIMDDQSRASILPRVVQNWPLILIGAGLFTNLAWVALWAWLLCRAITTLSWPLYEAVLAALR